MQGRNLRCISTLDLVRRWELVQRRGSKLVFRREGGCWCELKGRANRSRLFTEVDGGVATREERRSAGLWIAANWC